MTETGNPPRLTVVIPAYNEEKRILDTLGRVHDHLASQDYTSEILVVDDGSIDDTLHVVQGFADEHSSVRTLHHEPNRGKGYAVRAGVLSARGENVLICDADLATPIEELDSFWKHLSAGADIVIASRALADSRLVQRQPPYREFAGRMFNFLVQVLAVPGIHDTQCGFKLVRGEVGRHVFALCTLNGFSFDIEMLHIALRLGYRIAEVPVAWYHRPGSKVRMLRDGPAMLMDLLRMRVRHARVKRSTCSEG